MVSRRRSHFAASCFSTENEVYSLQPQAASCMQVIWSSFATDNKLPQKLLSMVDVMARVRVLLPVLGIQGCYWDIPFFIRTPPAEGFFGTVDSALSESSNFCYYGRVGIYNCMKGTHQNCENKKILPLRNLHCQCHFFKTIKYFPLFLWVRVNSPPSWLFSHINLEILG